MGKSKKYVILDEEGRHLNYPATYSSMEEAKEILEIYSMCQSKIPSCEWYLRHTTRLLTPKLEASLQPAPVKMDVDDPVGHKG